MKSFKLLSVVLLLACSTQMFGMFSSFSRLRGRSAALVAGVAGLLTQTSKAQPVRPMGDECEVSEFDRKIKYKYWCDCSLDIKNLKYAVANSPYRIALSELCLHRADLRGLNLREARLGRTNFRSADLRRADLSYANLSGSDMTGAKLDGANLFSTNLAEVKGLSFKNKCEAHRKNAKHVPAYEWFEVFVPCSFVDSDGEDE